MTEHCVICGAEIPEGRQVCLECEYQTLGFIRCKDCRHYDTSCCADGFGWCYRYDNVYVGDWYCADGERRADNEGHAIMETE